MAVFNIQTHISPTGEYFFLEQHILSGTWFQLASLSKVLGKCFFNKQKNLPRTGFEPVTYGFLLVVIPLQSTALPTELSRVYSETLCKGTENFTRGMSGWPSGLRRCVQVAVHFCGRGFESHFWQYLFNLVSLQTKAYRFSPISAEDSDLDF